MPKPYPIGFCDDVVRVARSRESGVTIEKIANDFGVHPMTLTMWMRRADIDEGAKPGQPHSWATREQLRNAIVTWIERTYHRRRRQARLGRLMPIEFETIMTEDVALAA